MLALNLTNNQTQTINSHIMKTIEIQLYKFDELSEEAQAKTIESLWDINVDHDWSEYTIDDAKNIGLMITEFDIDRSTIKAIFDAGAEQTAMFIIANHGAGTHTYKLATQYRYDSNRLIQNAPMDEAGEFIDEDSLEDEMQELNEDFLYDLREEYISMLKADYEYNTAKEQIISTIEANDYDFTEDGKLY